MTDRRAELQGTCRSRLRTSAACVGGRSREGGSAFADIHLVFSNIETWLLARIMDGSEPQHLQAYLNEYVFRFNRRFIR